MATEACKCCGPYGKRVLMAFFEAGIGNVKLRKPAYEKSVEWTPCSCDRGEPRLSALAPGWNGWCTCNPETTFLAALEAAIRAGHGTWSEEDYCGQLFVAVRAVAASAGLCCKARDLVLDLPKRPLKKAKSSVFA
jgi:hypothetical protein